MSRKPASLLSGLFALALLSTACGSRVPDGVHGGESHFLKGCESTCGGGLTCIDEKCTRECTKQSDCRGLADDAVCVGSVGEATCNVARAACEEGGLNHALGDEWSCSDGCNSCMCREQGVVRTLTPCGPNNPTGKQCEYDGKTYEVGDEWRCGCTSCKCTEDGVQEPLIACPNQCEYDGKTYEVGDEWRCGCTSCECTEDGIQVPDIACATQCDYDGETYEVGDAWTCSDGCNECTCLADGSVSTTDQACTTCSKDGQEYRLGDVIELAGGTTCVCVEPGLLGQCTGVVDNGGPGTSAGVTEPSDGGPAAGDDRARCSLPPDSGDCFAAEPAIYFDTSSGQCLQFIYGGCGGNANRFDNLGDCYDACGGDAF